MAMKGLTPLNPHLLCLYHQLIAVVTNLRLSGVSDIRRISDSLLAFAPMGQATLSDLAPDGFCQDRTSGHGLLEEVLVILERPRPSITADDRPGPPKSIPRQRINVPIAERAEVMSTRPPDILLRLMVAMVIHFH